MVDRRYSYLVCAIVLLGLGLRIAAAQGGLWLDEAWSAELARQAHTPLGVFLNINHDNNHHLNSLWLQCVGSTAAPVLQRALSIVTGTIGIAVTAEIFRQRDRHMALIAATLFAVSPMMVTMGSEARGYAGMTLALLTAILLVDRWLTSGFDDGIRLRLVLCFLLGTLSQLTMAFGCAALIGWVYLTLLRRTDPLAAARRTVHLFAAPMVALLAVIGMVAGAAWASPTGFQIGSYMPFGILLFLHGTIEMLGYTVGWPVVSVWLIPPVLILVLLSRYAGVRNIPFYALAIVAFPMSLAILHVGNTGHPRYYMLAAIALLLLIAETTATGIARGGSRRWLSGTLLAGVLAGGLWQDADLIHNQRGDPDPAVIAMRTRSPAGATVLLDRATGLAMLEFAAAHLRYPVDIVQGACRPAQFLFVDRFKGEEMPVGPQRCGATFDAIAGAYAHGLSGTHWTLYQRRS
ncbi:hypothetical protein [Sphingomonas sp. TREG-RG-20F-R18-01]|uniref:hypothetical protein n=1 Tax=Sphingomonas sp. TREG-RG-20F-R18-01 TaxID=2914982 RepID=UPI001F58C794|nr:hypothetical protein [Sphingomonas sp. TREG-RG-20F-R18-01]